MTKALFPQSSYHTLGPLHLEERVHLVSLEETSVATRMSARLCCITMCGGRGQSWCLHITITIPHTGPKHPSLQLPGVLAADCSQLTDWSLGESTSATLSLQVAFVDQGRKHRLGVEPLSHCGALYGPSKFQNVLRLAGTNEVH